MSVEKYPRPVFYDAKGWRGPIVSAITWGAWAIVVGLAATLLLTSIWGPHLPATQLSSQPRPISSPGLPPASFGEPVLQAGRGRKPSRAAVTSARRYAHFVNWDENSFASLKRNAQFLDVLIVEWLRLGGADGRVERDDPQKEALVRTWVASHAPGLKLLPLVNNFNAKSNVWDSEGVAQMLASQQARATFAEALHAFVAVGRYPGAVLDLEQVPRAARADFVTLVEELSLRFRGAGLRLLVSVPAGGSDYDYARLAVLADGIIVMTYDEHFEKGEPGPLAGQGWFEAVLERLSSIDPDKLIIGIGAYGYDWAGTGKAREISVQEAWELLESSQAILRFDRASLNPTFTYVDDIAGAKHHVWYLDGVTAYNQVAAALAKRPDGLALWRLGTEDPSVWAAFARGRGADVRAREAMQHLNSGYDVLYKGEGEVLSVTGTQAPGVRSVIFDRTHNLITDQRIVIFPGSTTITRWGARSDKVIALTFDDGPDPKYTPMILDILAQKGVKATFFLVGSAGAVNQGLLRRIFDEGHDIGNHTFTHPNLHDLSHERLRLELNATQRLLESTIGVRTKLFRPPFGADLEPQTIDGADALRVAGQLGYLAIGMKIDPKDWLRPLAQQIVAKTVEGALGGAGNVVLLHDAGGMRQATVDALPQIIDRLRGEGFRFVTTHELIGVSREAVMPSAAPEDAFIIAVNHAGFSVFSGMNGLFVLAFQLGIALGALRIVWIATFALIHARRERQRWNQTWTPASVAVIIPAYNEEKVVCASIRALLASTVSNFKIIVVDDGSRDRTSSVIREAFSGSARVEVLRQSNSGKWAALNHGIAHTDAEIIVTLDADTLFEPDAIALLVRHFADPSVAAVAGSANVGNRLNVMTRFQALEYVTNQNLDRRALEVVNGITVVPGSIGAWRRAALLAIGGFQPDTLAEDADATIRLERAGWTVLYEPRAVAHTEAPETVRAFLRQRLRWMFGTLQVAYKHRGAIASGRPAGVGLFGLPNVIVFQFLFTLLAPAIDLMLLWSLVSGLATYASQPQAGLPASLVTVLAYWTYFQILEVMTSGLAISLERRHDLWRLLPLILLQRFCYRQLLYVTALRVAAAALKGRMLGWAKLARTGAALHRPTAHDAALLKAPITAT